MDARKLTQEYTFNVATEATYKYFKSGKWYKSKRQDIRAKYMSPYGNEGYYGTLYCKSYFTMVTPEEWDECEPPKKEKI
jgi:hypothetical protein